MTYRSYREIKYWTINLNERECPRLMAVTRITKERISGSVDGVSSHCRPHKAFGIYHSEPIAKKVVDDLVAAVDVWKRRREQKLAELALINLHLDAVVKEHTKGLTNEHQQLTRSPRVCP